MKLPKPCPHCIRGLKFTSNRGESSFYSQYYTNVKVELQRYITPCNSCSLGNLLIIFYKFPRTEIDGYYELDNIMYVIINGEDFTMEQLIYNHIAQMARI
jgi:hypothetical protein